MLIINFKNYKVGKDVLDLAKKIEIYYNKAIIAVPLTELSETMRNLGPNMQVYAQHVDYQELGRGTGYIMPESLVNSRVAGSLLNHSEHKIRMPELKKTIKRCNELGLKIVICSSSLREVSQLRKLNPFGIAFEDKKLIATGKSITEHKQHDIKRFVDLLKDTDIIPLCGAGISTGEDAAHAIVLGCKGVLVSSVVASSQTPEKFLKEVQGVL